MGFPRQEYWRGLPLFSEAPSKWEIWGFSYHKGSTIYLHQEKEHILMPLLLFNCWVKSDSFVTPWTEAHQALHPWDFSGKNTEVGCYFLLQGIFPTQKPHLLHWQADSLPLSHQGSPLNAIRICLIQPQNLFLPFSPLPLYLLPFEPTSKADLNLQQRPKSVQLRALGPEIGLKDWILEIWGLGFHRGAEKVLITRNRSYPWFDFDGRSLLFVNNFQLSCLHFPCFSFFPGCSRLIHWLILPLSLYSHPFLWFSSSFHERGRIYLSLTLGLPCDLF